MTELHIVFETGPAGRSLLYCVHISYHNNIIINNIQSDVNAYTILYIFLYAQE